MPKGNPPKGGGSTGGSGAVRSTPRIGPRNELGKPKGGKGPYGGR